MTRIFTANLRSVILRRVMLILAALTVPACGGNESPTGPGGGTPIETSGEILYSRHRDGAGDIAPLASSQT